MDSKSYKPGTSIKVKVRDLYDDYKNYCSAKSIKTFENMANFKVKLEGLHYQIETGTNKKATMVHLDQSSNIGNPF